MPLSDISAEYFSEKSEAEKRVSEYMKRFFGPYVFVFGRRRTRSDEKRMYIKRKRYKKRNKEVYNKPFGIGCPTALLLLVRLLICTT